MPGTIACPECENLLIFYACDELEAGERAAVEQHLRECSACAAALRRELRLRQALASPETPQSQITADLLLAQCRSELAEALDDLKPRRRAGWLAALHPSNWAAKLLLPSLVRYPGWSAAMLLLMGIAVGTLAPQWYQSRVAQPPRPDMTVSANPRVSDQDLQTMGIAGINLIPDAGSGTPSVELHLTAEKPVVLQGTPDDTDVRRVLTFVILNGQRFDSGVRLDSVEVLRTRTGDSDVRAALCVAVHNDRNPGVRLKALEALRGSEQDAAVRQTLLDALERDACPGVRVEAINALQAALRAMDDKGSLPPDEHLVEVLRDRMQKDPNNYVRLQSAAAIRQFGPRELH